MMHPSEKLYQYLTPKQLDDSTFESIACDTVMGRLFGGEILAQTLSAASRTVIHNHSAHSMHAYFLRPGLSTKPVYFNVELLRDGRSFSTRHVVAKQQGRAIFSASVSFKEPESAVSHQPEAPNPPDPESLPEDRVRREQMGLSQKFADHDIFSAFDIRTVGPLPEEYKLGEKSTQGIWFKVVGPIVDEVLMQQCLLAYLSDIRLCICAMQPHGIRFMDKNVMAASLDHALWLYRPFAFDDWLYYDMAGPISADSRGLNFGHFYDVNGQLIASATQENLMRVR